jgi:hypothetical protein
MARRRSRFTWDARLARYRDARGHLVSNLSVRREIDRQIARHEREIASLSEQLRSGSIGLEEWRLSMRERVKAIHVSHAAASKGGWAQMSPADYGRAGQIIRREYGHLEKFATQISAGLPLDGRMAQRAKLYAQAGRGTFEATRHASMVEHGMDEERSILHVAEHCEQCVDQAALGWVPVGTLIPLGQRTCLGNDQCTMVYRRRAA